jgi:hypothetical protein
MERGPENTVVVAFEKNTALRMKNPYSPLCKISTRGYYATVSEFEDKVKVHIRKYVDND